MEIYNYRSETAEERLGAIAGRSISFRKKEIEYVEKIIEDVKTNGDKGLIEYIRRFDAPDLSVDALGVTDAEMAAAQSAVEPKFMDSLQRAARQIESFHRRQIRQSWIDMERPGTMLGQLVRPVDGAGVYVPGAKGGKTPLVSSVLMGVIPAKIAGVKKVLVATPPTKEGSVNPYLLMAAKIAGADQIFKMGSAWAIAALAYGTETVPRVDVIVGPGNIYVTLAKKIVSGTVGIDMIAGPSEILVIADHTADPDFIAADLLSQAEHDALSSAILVTTSSDLAEAAAASVEKQLAELSRKEIAAESLKNFGAILVVPDLDAAVEVANRIAPEHLELLVEDPLSRVGSIRNAGAIFMGDYTPEPVGDYIAGPNHVLPTAGTARFSSALSVDNFIKKISLIRYSKEAFDEEAQDILRLAEIEGLDAHARSVKVRMEK